MGSYYNMYPPLMGTPASGDFIYGPQVSQSTGLLGNGNLRLAPWFLPPGGVTLDQLSFEVTIVGTAGSVARIAVYPDSGYLYPLGAALFDSGQINTESSTGVKTYSATMALPYRIVWVGLVGQGAPGTTPTVRVRNSPAGYVLASNDNTPLTTPTLATGYVIGSVTGALPTIAGLSDLTVSGSVGNVIGRVA